jgi:hypothetical protein
LKKGVHYYIFSWKPYFVRKLSIGLYRIYQRQDITFFTNPDVKVEGPNLKRRPRISTLCLYKGETSLRGDIYQKGIVQGSLLEIPSNKILSEIKKSGKNE